MKVQVGNKIIGVLDGGVFEKHVKRSKHFFRKFGAWGIDAKIFKNLLLPRNALIRIVDEETMIVYECDAHTMMEKGHFLHFKGLRNDFGVQIFLSENEFRSYPLSVLRPRLAEKVESKRIEAVNKLI